MDCYNDDSDTLLLQMCILLPLLRRKVKVIYHMARPLRNSKIGSRMRTLEIFRGALSRSLSARKDDCLSAKRE